MPASVRSIFSPVATTDATAKVIVSSNQPGDHVFMLVTVYATFADTLSECGEVEPPTGWSVIHVPIMESALTVGQFALIFTEATETSFGELTITSPVDATAALMYVSGIVVRNAGGTPGADAQILGPYNTNNAILPTVDVHVDNTVGGLALASVGAFKTDNPPEADPPWRLIGFQETAVLHSAEVWLWQTFARDTDIASQEMSIEPPQLADAGGTGWYALAVIPLVPLTTPVVVSGDPRPERLTLTCADDYRAFITEADYETVVGPVGWSAIEWERVLDDISTASVTALDSLGGVKCATRFGGLVPWRFGLKIERNDRSVWKGPVTTVQRVPGGFRVTASDVLARFQKRLAIRESTLRFAEADAGTAFAAIVLSAQIADERWSLQPPEVTTFQPYTRTISARDFEYAWDILSDLGDAAVDFWVGDGTLYAYDVGSGWRYWDGFESKLLPGPYDSRRELVYGLFTERNFVELPTWSINGWGQANVGWIPGPDIGEEGARRFWSSAEAVSVKADGVLDIVETGNLYQPSDDDAAFDTFQEEVMQHLADSLVAQRAISPAVIEGSSLAQNAPVDVDNLRPGSIWLCDIFDDGWGQLLQASRLKRVTVRVTKNESGAVEETVTPVLIPVGYEEVAS